MATPILGYSAYWQPATNTGRIYLRIGQPDAVPDNVEVALDSAAEFGAMVDCLDRHANIAFDEEHKLIVIPWRKPGTK
ncbi:MAG: hypothetical protein U0640_08790 [Phycisphaerales bacterium]